MNADQCSGSSPDPSTAVTIASARTDTPLNPAAYPATRQTHTSGRSELNGRHRPGQGLGDREHGGSTTGGHGGCDAGRAKNQLNPDCGAIRRTAAPIAFVLASALVLALAALGYQPLWQPGPALTLAQTAYATDRATVYRMVKGGADPNEASLADAAMLTPLEAAVISRDLELVQILVGLGARVDDSNRRRLTCFAIEDGAQSIVTYLEGSALAAPPDCAGIHAPIQ